jgi:hypothetical protein
MFAMVKEDARTRASERLAPATPRTKAAIQVNPGGVYAWRN